MNLQRVGPLCLLPATVNRLGSNPEEILAEAGLSPTALDHPDNTIPYATMGHLLETAARRTRCPHFGLEMACGVGISSQGFIGELMRHAPTIGAALRDFSANHHKNVHGGVVYFRNAGDYGCWGYAVYRLGMQGSRHVCDAAAMIGFNILNELGCGDQIRSAELHLSHSAPEDIVPYRKSIKLRISFDRDQTAFLLPRRLLDQPVPGADPKIRKELQLRVKALQAARESDVVTILRRTLRTGLIEGSISAVAISAQMGMNRRTLQRRLEAEGLSFQLVLDETRFEFACQLLTHTKLSIAEVALIVGNAEASVLTRRFNQWCGMTPSHWRCSVEHVAVPMGNIERPTQSVANTPQVMN